MKLFLMYVDFQISGIENQIVSELSAKTIFHVVLNIIVVSIVSDETIFYVNQRSQSSL